MLVPNGAGGVQLPSQAFPVGSTGPARAAMEGRTQNVIETLLKADFKADNLVEGKGFHDFFVFLGKLPILGDLVEILTGIEDGDLSDLGTFVNQLGAILRGESIGSPLPTLVGATINTIRKTIEQITAIVKGDAVTAINNWVQDFKDGWAQLSGQIGNAVANAVDEAVNAVVDGMKGLGAFAAAITAAISAAINNAIESIFGDGGTKWGQELYVAAGPVTLGFNDVPLGFGMPFSGKITDIQFYSNDHVGGGGTGITVQTRKNGTTIHTGTWTGGSNTFAAANLNLSVAKGDRITFYVSSVTSQAANMSVSVMGRYV